MEMNIKHVFLWLNIILAGALLTACSSTVDISKTMQRNGRVYSIEDDEPFSGIVTGKGHNEGYRRNGFTYKKEYKNGLLHGKSYYYYPSGKIESVEPYDEGVLNGVVTRYYDNGQIRARIHFVDGFRGGAKGEMFWDRNGNKRKG